MRMTIGGYLLKQQKFNIIQKSGAWFAYKEYKLQGKDSVKELIKSKPELALEIKNLVFDRLGIKNNNSEIKPQELVK